MKNIFYWVFVITLTKINSSWCQSYTQRIGITLDCPTRRLSLDLDSSSRKKYIDSMALNITGKWRLIETHVDSNPSVIKSQQKTELLLNNKGNGYIYIDNQLVNSFHLTLGLYYGLFRFTIDEHGRRFFNLNNIVSGKDFQFQGRISTCEQFLSVSGVTSSGSEFIFIRVDQ